MDSVYKNHLSFLVSACRDPVYAFIFGLYCSSAQETADKLSKRARENKTDDPVTAKNYSVLGTETLKDFVVRLGNASQEITSQWKTILDDINENLSPKNLTSHLTEILTLNKEMLKQCGITSGAREEPIEDQLFVMLLLENSTVTFEGFPLYFDAYVRPDVKQVNLRSAHELIDNVIVTTTRNLSYGVLNSIREKRLSRISKPSVSSQQQPQQQTNHSAPSEQPKPKEPEAWTRMSSALFENQKRLQQSISELAKAVHTIQDHKQQQHIREPEPVVARDQSADLSRLLQKYDSYFEKLEQYSSETRSAVTRVQDQVRSLSQTVGKYQNVPQKQPEIPITEHKQASFIKQPVYSKTEEKKQILIETKPKQVEHHEEVEEEEEEEEEKPTEKKAFELSGLPTDPVSQENKVAEIIASRNKPNSHQDAKKHHAKEHEEEEEEGEEEEAEPEEADDE